MPSAFDDKNSKKTAIFLILIVIVVILILAFVFGGAQGFIGIFKVFFYLLLFVSFIGLLIYVVWFLFIKRHPRNIPIENWKTYLKSAKDNGADTMEDMILTGDQKHSAKKFMTIKGYLRVEGYNKKQYDMFVGKRSTWNPFEEYKIVMLEEHEHTDLIGDVYVYGISLIQKYGYYWLNSAMLDFDAIDKTVALETYRTLMYETLGDLKGLMDRATGIDPDTIKERQRDKLLKIPQLQGQQPTSEQKQ